MKQKAILLIDGDITSHINGLKEDEDDCISGIDLNLMYIVDRVRDFGYDVVGFKYFLSGENNFRKTINPTYKANRKSPKPPNLECARRHLLKGYNAFVVHGAEADDGIISMWQELTNNIFENATPIIVSSDKDFKQIPCVFYNIHHKHDKMEFFSDRDALIFRWSQMLEGDSADNVIGVRGIGKKITGRLLDGVVNDFGARRVVWREYKKAYGRKARDEYYKNLTMLRMIKTLKTPIEINTI